MKSSRFWVVFLLLSFSVVVLHVRGDVDRVPSSAPLTELPATIGPRTAKDIPLDQEVLAVLGKGDFLNRIYERNPNLPIISASDQVPITLFIGYFPTQRTGQSIHSPQNCLPAAGWTFQSRGTVDIPDGSGKEHNVGEYLITDGRNTQEVLYWYQLHGRSIASDYRAKLDTLADSIRYGRTDEALIRIMTPVQSGADREVARQRVVRFAEQIVPLLPRYIPN